MSSIYRQVVRAASDADHNWSLLVQRKQYSWPQRPHLRMQPSSQSTAIILIRVPQLSHLRHTL